MQAKLDICSGKAMSVVTSKQGPLKSVLKRKLRIQAEMQRGLERSLGAN